MPMSLFMKAKSMSMRCRAVVRFWRMELRSMIFWSVPMPVVMEAYEAGMRLVVYAYLTMRCVVCSVSVCTACTGQRHCHNCECSKNLFHITFLSCFSQYFFEGIFYLYFQTFFSRYACYIARSVPNIKTY